MATYDTKRIKKILIDDREGARINYAQLDAYADIDTEVEHLDYGDYIFIGHNSPPICFEYKTATDFLASLYSQRLHNQMALNIQQFRYTFVMVEAFNLETVRKKWYYQTGIDLTNNRINGAIASLNCVSTVLFAQTRESAFDLMLRQSLKIIADMPYMYKFTKKTSNPVLNYLSSIKGVSRKAEDIVDVLGLETLDDLLNVTVDDLTLVKGLGKTKAEFILKKIK